MTVKIGRYRHGHTAARKQTRTYTAWVNMLQRCGNPESSNYKYYGGRGIHVCERWYAFDSFLEDMGEAPPSMSLDRIKNSGPYTPANCRWASRKEQCRNQRTNRRFLYRGKKRALAEIAELIGMPHVVLRMRLWRGWSFKKAIGVPVLPVGKKST